MATISTIPLPKLTFLMNNFILNTTNHLNKLSVKGDEKLAELDKKLNDLEIMTTLLESKLNSLPDNISGSVAVPPPKPPKPPITSPPITSPPPVNENQNNNNMEEDKKEGDNGKSKEEEKKEGEGEGGEEKKRKFPQKKHLTIS